MQRSPWLPHFACVLALGLLACRAADQRDELILKSAEKHLGMLSSCDDAGCTLDESKFPRGEIAWIGLGTGDANPPTVVHPDVDEEHLRDGSVHRGRLLSIDSAKVATDGGSWERSQVAFVHLAGAAEAARSSAEALPEHRPEYEWDGKIEVSTSYRAKAGVYDWRAAYHVAFREVPQHDSTPDGSRAYPIQLEYAYQANHDWDQGVAHTPPGDVHLHGASSGVVSAFDRFGTAPGLRFTGDVLRIDAPQPHVAVPASFDTRKDLDAFFAEPQTQRPGHYDLWITTAGSPADERALYQGILLTGGGIQKFGGPDADALAFLNEVPSYVPLGTTLRGFLEDPDQREVSGGYSFRDGPQDEEAAISIRWTFTRTRKEIDLDSAAPAVTGCGADLASLEHKMHDACSAAQADCQREPGGCDASKLKRFTQRCQNRVDEYQKASAACAPQP